QRPSSVLVSDMEMSTMRRKRVGPDMFRNGTRLGTAPDRPGRASGAPPWPVHRARLGRPPAALPRPAAGTGRAAPARSEPVGYPVGRPGCRAAAGPAPSEVRLGVAVAATG